MKIIKTDNFCRETVPDVLIAENVNGSWGRIIVAFLNETFSSHTSPDYFKLVGDDVTLSEGFQP